MNARKSICQFDWARRPRAETDQSFLALWFCNLPYFFWTMFGFGVGWATTNILWRFRVLNPWWDDPFTFTSIFGPMVLASLYATRKAKRYRVRLPLRQSRQHGYFTYSALHQVSYRFFLNHMLLNEHVPYIIAPWVAVAGLLAIGSRRIPLDVRQTYHVTIACTAVAHAGLRTYWHHYSVRRGDAGRYDRKNCCADKCLLRERNADFDAILK